MFSCFKKKKKKLFLVLQNQFLFYKTKFSAGSQQGYGKGAYDFEQM